MASGTLWVALWLGALAGGVVSPGAARAQEPPAQEPRAADLSITASGGTKGMPRPGELVTYTLAIANAGPSEGNRAQLSLAPDPANVSVDHVSGACDALPCYLPTIAPGASRSVEVGLRIASGGGFGFTARVRALEPDPDRTNNVAIVSVTPPAPTPTPRPIPTPTPTPSAQFSTMPVEPPPWWQALLTPWLLGGGALLLPLLIVGSVTTVRRRRRARWLERLSVTADPGPEPSLATGPIAFAGPVLTLSIRCEAGKAGPLGAVPILGVTYG